MLKLNFESNITPKCLWVVVTLAILLLNIMPGGFLCEVLRLNMIFWACFVGSGLKLIFHCIAYSFNLERCLFNRLAELVILWTTENSDPWGAPGLTSKHEKFLPFNTTLTTLQLKNFFIKVISSPDIPFCCNLKCKPPCKTLSNALDI